MGVFGGDVYLHRFGGFIEFVENRYVEKGSRAGGGGHNTTFEHVHSGGSQKNGKFYGATHYSPIFGDQAFGERHKPHLLFGLGGTWRDHRPH